MKIVLISEDPKLQQQVHADLSGGGHEILTMPHKRDGLRGIATELAPELMLLDNRDREHVRLEDVEQLTLHHPNIAVLLLSDLATPRFLLAAMRAGVREVLPASQYKDLLAAAVERVQTKLAAAQSTGRAPVHAFIGAGGGSGTTFLATNFGYQLAQSHKVLLIDLNLQFGDALSFVHEGKASRTIAELARDLKRLDGALLTAGAVHVTPNYHVLAAPDEPAQAADIRCEHVETILDLAVTQYDYVLLDLPRSVDANLVAALDRAASIFLVLQASVPMLRNAGRLLTTFRSLDYARDKIALILNRYDRRNEITHDRIRRTLGPFDLHTIANGYRQVSTAINQGVPLAQLERRHGVTRGLAALGDTMTPQPEHAAGLIQRLFQRA